MLIIVNKENQSNYLNELASMHRLRKRVFKDTMKWPVNVVNGMEFDQFDTPDAHYIMHINEAGEVDGCTRLLPTTKPYLLGDVFSDLIESGEVPRKENIWESTRFCSDSKTAPKNIMGLLAGGMLEFALSKGIQEYVSVSDIRIETLIKRYGWFPERLGKTIDTGTEIAAGERFEVTSNILQKVSTKCKKMHTNFIENLGELNEFQNHPIAA